MYNSTIKSRRRGVTEGHVDSQLRLPDVEGAAEQRQRHPVLQHRPRREPSHIHWKRVGVHHRRLVARNHIQVSFNEQMPDVAEQAVPRTLFFISVMALRVPCN